MFLIGVRYRAPKVAKLDEAIFMTFNRVRADSPRTFAGQTKTPEETAGCRNCGGPVWVSVVPIGNR